MFGRNHLIMQLLIVVIGFTLSFKVFEQLENSQNQLIQSEFESEVESIASDLFLNIMTTFESKHSLAGIFRQKVDVSADEFSREAQMIIQRHKGIHALEWVPKVKKNNKIQLEESMQKSLPLFQFTEMGENGFLKRVEEREVYYPVYYVEPLAGNELALGFDLSSNPIRAEALNKAKDSGVPVATAKITLVQEKIKSAGFLTFFPVYGGIPTTLEARNSSLIGFVSGAFVVGEIVADSLKKSLPLDVRFNLQDITDADSPELLYSHAPEESNLGGVGTEVTTVLPEIWGRKWQISATVTEAYIAQRKSSLPRVVLTSILLATVFVSICVWILSNQTKKIANEVLIRTKELAEVNKRLEQLSRTDSLTGIHNRRYFDEQLAREWARSLRQHSLLSILIIDIDFFKNFNDCYGHIMGDDCLKKVALTLLKSTNRAQDTLARYGGEEFVVILPETENPDVLAERYRQAIEDCQIENSPNENKPILTVSIGCAVVLPQSNQTPSSLVQMADEALYSAKESGRNKVVFYQSNENSSINPLYQVTEEVGEETSLKED